MVLIDCAMTAAWRQPSGHRPRAAGALIAALLLVLVTGAPVPVVAQEPILSTPYPAVAVQPGATASFDLMVRADAPQRVDLRSRASLMDGTPRSAGEAAR